MDCTRDWLILIAGIVAATTFADENIFDGLGWVALGFGTAGLVLAAGGVTMIWSR